MSKAKICLMMVLGNEQAVIARCLRAARPMIDCWSISCNGTDVTREIVQRELVGIPGVLHERPWKNFGHNRTESFQLAQEWLRENGYDLEQTWCLALDADHELQPTIDVRLALECHGYAIRQYDKARLTDYANKRLLRASDDWRSLGVTHEVWSCGGDTPTLPGIGILDHGDGGSKGSKIERDEALLRAGLADPADADMHARYKFYLAQTLQDAKRWEEAAEWYRQRAETRGHFEEERWMAAYRRGRCLLWLGKYPDGEAQLIRAWEERPHRIEPLYWLAKHHLDQGRNHAAHALAKVCADAEYPDDILFIEPFCYRAGPQELLAISGFYVGDKPRGAAACEALMATTQPELGKRNVCWYAETLDGERSSFEVPEELRTFDGTLYHCSSPSVCGDVTLVRLVNYEQEKGRRYWGRPDPWKIKTKAAIRKGDEPWRVLDGSILESWEPARISGLEDIRLTEWRDRLWFTATTCQAPGSGGNPQVVLGRLSEDLSRVTQLSAIGYDKRQTVEKNWILWPREDALYCVYSFDPFVLLKLDTDTGEAIEVSRSPTRWYPGRFRGSSPVFSIQDAKFAIVHDVSNLEHENVYTHRILQLAPHGVGRVSKPFLLEHRGIEYVAGAQFDHNSFELQLTYSVEDKTARSIRVKANALPEWLS